MTTEQGDLTFDPVNMGQALNVLADVVASYVTTSVPAGLADKDAKAASQLAVTIFLHSLLMRSKHKMEMAGLLDIISAELRDAAAAEANAQGIDPATDELRGT
ncbi:hypothetical protein [Bradyrhizobium sp. 144]|uniref:hypothetical protein n=1 Tax=Bradyrhizobium sp. 144 TaxID=2782620 RepID=UPI001FF908C4|nr:hypothetical protein [Bradyrhizobium sp. 144]MCK1693683.1 hypothetical protein [Bradyrhizobium sp. 144]